jgi:S1-C subfamily serine protease
VRVLAVQQPPNLLQPWAKVPPRSISGSGTVIQDRRILTSAHLVMYASQVYVESYQSNNRIPAKVAAMDLEFDLALLELKDESFFESRHALRMASALPRVRDAVTTYGYPVGGIGLSTTSGIVSRIEYDIDGLRIEVSANLNPGDSGGPAVANGQMIGLVFGVNLFNPNTGYIIPCEEIQAFLRQDAEGECIGRAQIYDEFQILANDALRRKMGLSREITGVLVRSADRARSDSLLRKEDVILKIGSYEIDNYGMVQVRQDLRLPFSYLIAKTAEDHLVRLTLLREGETCEIGVPVSYDRDWVIPSLKGEYPSYLVYGPLVFSTASEELVASLTPYLADVWSLQQSPLLWRRGETVAFEGEQLVVVTDMLPHEVDNGYDNPAGQVVTRVNGITIRNLRHLAEILRDADDGYLEFEFAEKFVETIVFDREEVLAATEEVLVANGIRQRCSADLHDVWQPKE